MQTDYDATTSRPIKLTYPNGLELGLCYNLHGYLTQEYDAVTNTVYRKVTAMDARNLITQSLLANLAMVETVDYATQTGQMRGISVTKFDDVKHALDYLYDGFGNLHYRHTQHGIDRAEEFFEYDNLHRITQSTRSYNPAVVIGANPDEIVTYGFDAVGNLTHKSDYASAYDYTGAKPNAVKQVTLAGGGSVNFIYDQNGNMTVGHNKTMAYNVFNKPSEIVSGGSTSQFYYGADTMRYKKVETGNQNVTTLYIDKVMEIVDDGNTVKTKAYVGSAAVVTDTTENGITTRNTHYLLKGRLGSTITVTDDQGNVVETNGFDPFGKPRTGLWKDKASNTLDSQVTTRGYTGHEHLDESQLIHMNGRAYDYNLGRFLSVDPLIQAPGNSQSMNPYSYIMNNPLAGVDPTGYCSTKDSVADCGDTVDPGQTSEITDQNGNVVGHVGKDKDGNLHFSNNGSEKGQQAVMSAVEDGGSNTTKLLGQTSINKISEQKTPSSSGESGFFSSMFIDFFDIDLGLGDALGNLNQSVDDHFLDTDKPGDKKSTISEDIATAAMAAIAETTINAYIDVTGNAALMALPVDELLAMTRVAKVAKGAKQKDKFVVLGEGMGDIKVVAKQLQSQGINAKWYQAWGKNFPVGRPMNPSELAAALARNERWIRSKIKDGYKFFDIGIDATRSVRSPFYKLEQSIIRETGTKTTKLNRPN